MTDEPTPQKTRPSEGIGDLPDAQRQRLARIAEEVRAYEAAPAMKLELKGQELEVTFDSDSAEAAILLQMAEIGTRDRNFHRGIVSQVVCLGSHGRKVDSEASNFVLSVIRAVKPRDELEAMLATQMGAIHAATMMLAKRLNQVDTIPQQDSAERALNKLARTYVTQMEALKRYRTGGQQKVTVEHVTVEAGGQAIVGAVRTGKDGAG